LINIVGLPTQTGIPPALAALAVFMPVNSTEDKSNIRHSGGHAFTLFEKIDFME
jgi:hypothetical protein